MNKSKLIKKLNKKFYEKRVYLDKLSIYKEGDSLCVYDYCGMGILKLDVSNLKYKQVCKAIIDRDTQLYNLIEHLTENEAWNVRCGGWLRVGVDEFNLFDFSGLDIIQYRYDVIVPQQLKRCWQLCCIMGYGFYNSYSDCWEVRKDGVKVLEGEGVGEFIEGFNELLKEENSYVY